MRTIKITATVIFTILVLFAIYVAATIKVQDEIWEGNLLSHPGTFTIISAATFIVTVWYFNKRIKEANEE